MPVMCASDLYEIYNISSPAPDNWRGQYICSNGYLDKSWTWYRDSNRNHVNSPHVTVVFDSHEVESNGVWAGFHLSVPFKTGRNATINGRYNYEIRGGTAKYSNTSKKGFTSEQIEAIDLFGNNNASALNAFARAFYEQAMEEDFFLGLASLS
jgi:hypothetical protein